jgi:hypothetical protein
MVSVMKVVAICSITKVKSGMVFDNQKTMVLGIRNDLAERVIDALGLTICIEGQSTAISYAAIFDSLWIQTEM